MKKLILSSIMALLMTETQVSAQVSAYSFSQSVQSYGLANTGTVLGTRIQDDEVNTALLPFAFEYNGTTYTAVNVCSNGYLSFNTLTGSEYSAISDMFSANVIAPFAQDLFMGTVIKGDLTSGDSIIVNVSSLGNLSVGDTLLDLFFDFGGVSPVITAITGGTITLNMSSNNTVAGQDLFFQNGSIRQEITGTSPNRVCEFEYRNMTRFPVYDESINFKVRLYETSNSIEFLYGPMIAGQSATPSEVGLKGASNVDYKSRSVGSSNTWSTSVATTFITDVCDFAPGTVPDAGLSYLWSPTACVAPSLSVTSSNMAMCAGETVTLSAAGATTYSWSNGSTGAHTTVSPTVSTTFILIGFEGACSSSISVFQNVVPQPTLSVTQSKPLTCTGETTTLTVFGAPSYSWSNGAVGAQINVSPTITTSYTVFGFDGTCSDSIVVKQNVIPQPTLTVTQTKTLICKGQTATITVSGAGTYSWSNGSNSDFIVVSPTATTNYTVSGSNSDCTSKSVISLKVGNCVGIDEESSSSKSIGAYPNPFADRLTIQNPFQGTATIKLFDLLGNIVHENQVEGLESYSVETDGLKAGIYVLVLEQGADKLAKKVIKR